MINKKIILGALIVILVLGGGYLGHKKLWWFTPAYAQRQTLQTFFSDLSKGKDQQAYSLTTSVFQSSNP